MTSAECSVGSESALQKRDEATFSQPWGGLEKSKIFYMPRYRTALLATAATTLSLAATPGLWQAG